MATRPATEARGARAPRDSLGPATQVGGREGVPRKAPPCIHLVEPFCVWFPSMFSLFALCEIPPEREGYVEYTGGRRRHHATCDGAPGHAHGTGYFRLPTPACAASAI